MGIEVEADGVAVVGAEGGADEVAEEGAEVGVEVGDEVCVMVGP